MSAEDEQTLSFSEQQSVAECLAAQRLLESRRLWRTGADLNSPPSKLLNAIGDFKSKAAPESWFSSARGFPKFAEEIAAG